MATSRKERSTARAASGAAADSNNECGALIPIRTGNYELAWDAAGEKLVITVDCAARVLSAAQASRSGKTRILATTSGFVTLPLPGIDGLQLSLTATLPLAGAGGR
jgi:hypothetical protein